MANLIVEKELHNETKYRNLYRDLLKKHQGLLTATLTEEQESNLEDFKDETEILRGALRTERNAWIMGMTVGLAAFVTIRFLPKVYIRRFGGEEKLRKLKEADELARQKGTAWAQGAIALLIEGSLSFWVGYRAFQLASQTTEGAYERIAQVPLCKGRSIIADNVCSEWVQITKKEIPQGYWDNVDEAKVQDTKSWNAFRSLSQNCVKRKLYERVVRKELGVPASEPVSLPNKVPDYMPAALELTKEQVLQLVADRK